MTVSMSLHWTVTMRVPGHIPCDGPLMDGLKIRNLILHLALIEHGYSCHKAQAHSLDLTGARPQRALLASVRIFSCNGSLC
jgi:hypothetical protein